MVDNSLEFKEKQRFDSMIIYVLVAAILVISSILSLNGFDYDIIQYMGIPVLIVSAIYFTFRMHTTINQSHLKVRMTPLTGKWHTFEYAMMKNAKIVKYSPIMEFGGYGYRFSFGGNRAFNMSGNVGLRFTYKEKEYTIGTNQPKEFYATLKEYLPNVKYELAD